jgi:hypothetical protein
MKPYTRVNHHHKQQIYIHFISNQYLIAVVNTSLRWSIHPRGGQYILAVVNTSLRWSIPPSGGQYLIAVVNTS